MGTSVFEQEFQQMRESQRAARQRTEFRPGQEFESEFAELNRRRAEARDQSAIRFPVAATAVGLGVSAATFFMTRSATLAGLAGSIAAVPADLVQSHIETELDLPTKPKSLSNAVGRAAGEGVAFGAGEALFQLPMRALRRTGIFNLFKGSVTPEAKESFQFLETLPGTIDPALLPAQATRNAPLDVMHNVAEHSFFGRGTIEARRALDEAQHDGLAQQWVKEIGKDLATILTKQKGGGPTTQLLIKDVTPEQAGQLFVASAKQNKRIATYPAKWIYNTIQNTIKPRPKVIQVVEQQPTGLVDATGRPLMRDVTKDKTILVGRRTNFGAAKRFAGDIKATLDRNQGIGSEIVGGGLLDDTVKMPDNPFVYDLIEHRKVLRAKRVQLESSVETNKSPAIGNLKVLEQMTDEAVENGFLANRMPDQLGLWRGANEIFKKGSSRFNNGVVKAMGKKAELQRRAIPEDVVTTAFQPGKTARMKIMKDAVSPEAWGKIAEQGMGKIYARAAFNDAKTVNGKTLVSLLLNPKSGLGERGLATAVGPVAAQNWLKLAKAVELRQAKQAAKEGSMLVQLKQGGALIEVFGGVTAVTGAILTMNELDLTSAGLTFSGTAVLVAPWALARMMVNPRSARLLIEGVKAGTVEKGIQVSGLIGGLIQAMIPRKVDTLPTTAPQPFRQQAQRDVAQSDVERNLFAIGAP